LSKYKYINQIVKINQKTFSGRLDVLYFITTLGVIDLSLKKNDKLTLLPSVYSQQALLPALYSYKIITK